LKYSLPFSMTKSPLSGVYRSGRSVWPMRLGVGSAAGVERGLKISATQNIEQSRPRRPLGDVALDSAERIRILRLR